MKDGAINVQNVSKIYKLYDKPTDRLKEALGFTKEKRYKEHYALNDVSFHVEKGETVGIIGTNGSGKSTVLKIITGVLNPTSGNVTIEGRISALLELGAGFNMEYTGIENVYLNGTMIGFTREEIDKKMDAILAFADIGDFVYQPVKTYSSGMFVRLAFAVAINIEPEILIVDEALSVGDVFFQAKCYKKFEEFKKEGRTILFVSHDLGSVSKYCDRVILLNNGIKLDEGIPKDMVSLYKKLLVKQPVSKDTATKLEIDELVKSQTEKNSLNNDTVFELDTNKLWKSNYALNPNVDEYGTGDAEVIDFAIIDDQGIMTNTIEKGTRFKIKSKVFFYKNIEDPIFTYTFKTVTGIPITGTNTMYEKVSIGSVVPGDIYIATFEQDMFLQGGEYLLSVSCTGYSNGDFRVYHRLYDVCSVTVVSDKNTVGYYDMNSKTSIKKVD